VAAVLTGAGVLTGCSHIRHSKAGSIAAGIGGGGRGLRWQLRGLNRGVGCRCGVGGCNGVGDECIQLLRGLYQLLHLLEGGPRAHKRDVQLNRGPLIHWAQCSKACLHGLLGEGCCNSCIKLWQGGELRSL
jgi:hypothetical protein